MSTDEMQQKITKLEEDLKLAMEVVRLAESIREDYVSQYAEYDGNEREKLERWKFYAREMMTASDKLDDTLAEIAKRKGNA